MTAKRAFQSQPAGRSVPDLAIFTQIPDAIAHFPTRPVGGSLVAGVSFSGPQGDFRQIKATVAFRVTVLGGYSA